MSWRDWRDLAIALLIDLGIVGAAGVGVALFFILLDRA